MEDFVQDLKSWANMSEDEYGNVLISLSEAVTNAIKHGNQQDASKNVHIEASKQNNSLKVIVEDEGTGFDPDSIPDPRKDENLLNTGGRGVFLMEHYADEVVYKNEGSTLILTFKLQ